MSSTETPQRVEDCLRHESAKLTAVLTRPFSVRHLDLVVDMTNSLELDTPLRLDSLLFESLLSR